MTMQRSGPNADPRPGPRTGGLPGRVPLLAGITLTGLAVALPLGYIALVLLAYADADHVDGLGLPQQALPVAILAGLVVVFVVVVRSLWGGPIALTATGIVGCVVVLTGLVMVTAQTFILQVFIWGLVVILAGSLLVAGAVRSFRGRHGDAPSAVSSDTDGEYPVVEPDHDAGAAP